MRKLSLIVVCVLTLSACSLDSPRGSGPIIISDSVEQGFEEYKGRQNPTYFAVAVNGQSYGYSYCAGTKCRKGGQHIALRDCRNYTSESISCKIFARGRDVVWDGPVHFRSDGKPDPALFGEKPFFFGPVFD